MPLSPEERSSLESLGRSLHDPLAEHLAIMAIHEEDRLRALRFEREHPEEARRIRLGQTAADGTGQDGYPFTGDGDDGRGNYGFRE